jgi:hypothetical protein
MCVWSRNDRKITSEKAGKLGPNKETCRFGDEYNVKYNMDYDEHTNRFSDKVSKLYLHEKHDEHSIIGECMFNLGDYADKGEKTVPMSIRTHTDPNAFIETVIEVIEINETKESSVSIKTH